MRIQISSTVLSDEIDSYVSNFTLNTYEEGYQEPSLIAGIDYNESLEEENVGEEYVKEEEEESDYFSIDSSKFDDRHEELRIASAPCWRFTR